MMIWTGTPYSASALARVSSCNFQNFTPLLMMPGLTCLPRYSAQGRDSAGLSIFALRLAAEVFGLIFFSRRVSWLSSSDSGSRSNWCLLTIRSIKRCTFSRSVRRGVSSAAITWAAGGGVGLSSAQLSVEQSSAGASSVERSRAVFRFIFYLSKSLLWVWIDMRMPKAAINVTIEVPP